MAEYVSAMVERQQRIWGEGGDTSSLISLLAIYEQNPLEGLSSQRLLARTALAQVTEILSLPEQALGGIGSDDHQK